VAITLRDDSASRQGDRQTSNIRYSLLLREYAVRRMLLSNGEIHNRNAYGYLAYLGHISHPRTYVRTNEDFLGALQCIEAIHDDFLRYFAGSFSADKEEDGLSITKKLFAADMMHVKRKCSYARVATNSSERVTGPPVSLTGECSDLLRAWLAAGAPS
jgi:hypothetical protein